MVPVVIPLTTVPGAASLASQLSNDTHLVLRLKMGSWEPVDHPELDD